MADQNRPLDKNSAPDTARSYERAKPEAEAGMGKLDAPKAPASQQPDRMHEAVTHRQDSKQVNSDDVVNADGNKIPASGQAAHGGEKDKKQQKLKPS